VSTAAKTSCSDSSRAAGEPLAGSATRVDRWLLVEVAGRWGRDVDETELPPDLRAVTDGFGGRVQLIRRPDRRRGESLLFVAESDAHGGSLWRVRADGAVLTRAGSVSEQLVLVCCHGRRDPCCARLGTPVFDALGDHVPGSALWQTSHVGGHRFAANVVVLPAGILLGRVGAAEAAYVAAELAARRIPLDHYRGRTVDAPESQAAEASVRKRLGLAGFGEVSVIATQDRRVLLATPDGELEATVEVEEGPPVIESCGKDPALSTRYVVHW
jgi:hypothetical protein